MDRKHTILSTPITLPVALILDVRGALLHPIQDIPIDNELLLRLLSCHKAGINIALITGSSIKTVQDYVLNPIGDLDIKMWGNGLYIYTETGCSGFIVYDVRKPEPLQDYEELVMDRHMLASILGALQFVSDQTRIKGKIGVRSGQVNFYCNLRREERNRFADNLKTYFFSKGIENLNIIVPSAKLSIDISLSSKKRAVLDLKTRLGLVEFRDVLFISDSLQVDGSDAGLIYEMPGVTAFHVGPSDANIFEGVNYIGGGPQGTNDILSHIAKT